MDDRRNYKTAGQLARPGTYCIRVLGRLDPAWSGWFDGLAVEAGSLPGGAGTTTLTGVVADQAALFGLLQKLYALRLPLVSVQRLDDMAQDGVSQG